MDKYLIYYYDFEGNIVRLTEERLEHILLHPEMIEMTDKIEETLLKPEFVIQSKADSDVKLFNKLFVTKSFGDKYLCVVVKYLESDAFIITSYLISNLPKGEILWQRN